MVGMHYRAVIIGVPAPNTFTALLIDFGKTRQFKGEDLVDMWPAAAQRKALAVQITATGSGTPLVLATFLSH